MPRLIYDFSTLYTTLPHNLIKEKLTDLFEQILKRDGSLYLTCSEKRAFYCLIIIVLLLMQIKIHERDFILSPSDNNQADVIEAFNSTSRYLDDLLNINNP